MTEVGYEIGFPLEIKVPTGIIERFDALTTPVTLVVEVPIVREGNPNGSNEKVLAVLFKDLKVSIKTNAVHQGTADAVRFEQKIIRRELNLDDTAETLPMSPDFFLDNGGTPRQSPPTSPSIL